MWRKNEKYEVCFSILLILQKVISCSKYPPPPFSSHPQKNIFLLQIFSIFSFSILLVLQGPEIPGPCSGKIKQNLHSLLGVIVVPENFLLQIAVPDNIFAYCCSKQLFFHRFLFRIHFFCSVLFPIFSFQVVVRCHFFKLFLRITFCKLSFQTMLLHILVPDNFLTICCSGQIFRNLPFWIAFLLQILQLFVLSNVFANCFSGYEFVNIANCCSGQFFCFGTFCFRQLFSLKRSCLMLRTCC